MNNFVAFSILVGCLWYYTLKYKLRQLHQSLSYSDGPWLLEVFLLFFISVYLIYIGATFDITTHLIETSLFIQILGLIHDLFYTEFPGRGAAAAFCSVQFVIFDPASSLTSHVTNLGIVVSSLYLCLFLYHIVTKYGTLMKRSSSTNGYRVVEQSTKANGVSEFLP